jgi:Flp pilus assembly protein TadG
MRFSKNMLHKRPRRGLPARGLMRDESGSAAVEFALVAMPFLLFVLGTIGMGLYFLAGTSLEYGAESAARKIRTGEAEKGENGSSTPMKVSRFRELVCSGAGPAIDCSKMTVHVSSAKEWSGITPPSCTDAPTGVENEQISKYSGTAGDVVLVTLCYRWDMAKNFSSFLKLGSGPGGTGDTIIQASTAFKNEPYK